MTVVDTTRAAVSADSPLGDATSALFGFEASKEDWVVARLYGFESDEHRVRVASEVYPFASLERSGAQWLFHDFRTQEHARRFADEALVALEYLGCTVIELGAGAGSRS